MVECFCLLHAVPDLVTSVWVASHVTIGEGDLEFDLRSGGGGNVADRGIIGEGLRWC